MKTLLNSKTRTLLEDSWRLTPARMAERLTNGRFQRYKHIQYLEKKLAQAIVRGGARLVISMPPRHGKSWLASLFTPAWFLSLWPDRNVILASHDAALAAHWGQAVREFLRDHQEVLGHTTGQVFTAGVGGQITGSGGHLIVVDDPLKSWKEAASENVRQRQIEWFNSTLSTAAEPGASIVVIMTRWHERDLAGYLESEHGDKWEVLKIPAIAEDGDALGRAPGIALCEERFGVEELEQIQVNVGSRNWEALYQQCPGPEGGKVLKRDWWKFYRVLPEAFDEVVQTWDLAFKDTKTSDYVVGQVWGRIGANKYLIDQVRAKMDFPATLKAVRELSIKHPLARRKLIEDKANGSAVIAMLRDAISGIIVVQPDGGKEARVAAISADVESGNVFLPAPGLAPWIEDFLTECAEFPDGRHDDQVDAMAYAIKHLQGGSR